MFRIISRPAKMTKSTGAALVKTNERQSIRAFDTLPSYRPTPQAIPCPRHFLIRYHKGTKLSRQTHTQLKNTIRAVPHTDGSEIQHSTVTLLSHPTQRRLVAFRHPFHVRARLDHASHNLSHQTKPAPAPASASASASPRRQAKAPALETTSCNGSIVNDDITCCVSQTSAASAHHPLSARRAIATPGAACHRPGHRASRPWNACRRPIRRF